MPKGVPNKRYTPEFKKLVIETMQEEKLSYSETCRRFEVNSRDRIKSWERIYLEEGPEGFAVERRGRSNIEDFDEVVKLDVQSIDNWSRWGDIKILFKTVYVVFAGRGAK